MKSRSMDQAFTLIELLIVVAIIAILAAIAVPNFLEAQMRSKVARAKADQHSIVMGLESYAIDNSGKYPPHNIRSASATTTVWVGWANAQRRLTSPIAYMSSLIPDIFQLKPDQLMSQPGLLTGDYWVEGNPVVDKSFNPLGRGAKHVMDYEQFNKNQTQDWQDRWVLSYGRSAWKLQSFGPMRDVNNWAWAPTVNHPGFPDKYYDPTNGTISGGLITRTQVYNK